jgi:hypothetical protein
MRIPPEFNHHDYGGRYAHANQGEGVEDGVNAAEEGEDEGRDQHDNLEVSLVFAKVGQVVAIRVPDGQAEHEQPQDGQLVKQLAQLKRKTINQSVRKEQEIYSSVKRIAGYSQETRLRGSTSSKAQ